MALQNPHLKTQEADFLYHIGYKKEECSKFKDVKFVVTGGSPDRMAAFAKLIARELGTEEEEITRTDRFKFFKIGSHVLSISHGMGVPSLSIMLHEMLKLLHYAKAKDPVIIRIGTSGGIGVDPGTVVVTNRSFNAYLEESHEVVILGKKVSRPAMMNQELAQEIASCHYTDSFQTILSGTMCTDDFYEGQGRLDGSICEFKAEDKMEYLERVHAKGISNIEMECTVIASLCGAASVRCSVVCVTLLDRLKGDQVTVASEDYTAFSLRPQELVAKFIKGKLLQDGDDSATLETRKRSSASQTEGNQTKHARIEK